MDILQKELVIIGGGPAGLTAACTAYDEGVRDLLIIERENELGGILKQCIHNGFGLHKFGEELTGPEYAARYEEKTRERQVPYVLNTMVTDIKEMEDGTKRITAMNSEKGLFAIDAKAVILAMGCRERPRGSMNIPGTRPAGIYTAGAAQKYVNLMGYLPGKEVVILGSGDIGLIMARRMTLEGAHVSCVLELMPYSGGLARNIEQCLNDYNIPLRLSTTVTEIHGRDRLTGVTVAKVNDDTKAPIPGTDEYIPCDTLLLSVGLIPENELSRKLGLAMDPVTKGPVATLDRETSVKGVFACGNVLHVHDLADHVSDEAEIAAKAAARYLRGETLSGEQARFEGKKPPKWWLREQEEKKKGLVPARETAGIKGKDSTGNERLTRELICISCPNGCVMTVRFEADGRTIRKISGNTCSRGEEYARQECMHPKRMVTSTVSTEEGGLLACKTEKPVPKERVKDVIAAINQIVAPKGAKVGDVLLSDAAGTGVAVVATANA